MPSALPDKESLNPIDESKEFAPKTDIIDHRFVYYKAKIKGNPTTISFDPFIAEFMIKKIGSEIGVKNWVKGRAFMIAALTDGNKKAGLSRLVQREALRLLLAPAKSDIDFMKKIISDTQKEEGVSKKPKGAKTKKKTESLSKSPAFDPMLDTGKITAAVVTKNSVDAPVKKKRSLEDIV